jgi:hypothetical protein
MRWPCFDYVADDQNGDTATATAVITVMGVNGFPWHNAASPFDVNNDTLITAVGDVLPLINEVNQRTLINAQNELPVPPEPGNGPPPFYDVSADNLLTAVADILVVINELNRQSGEGEAQNAWGAALAQLLREPWTPAEAIGPATAPRAVLPRNADATPVSAQESTARERAADDFFTSLDDEVLPDGLLPTTENSE